MTGRSELINRKVEPDEYWGVNLCAERWISHKGAPQTAFVQYVNETMAANPRFTPGDALAVAVVLRPALFAEHVEECYRVFQESRPE